MIPSPRHNTKNYNFTQSRTFNINYHLSLPLQVFFFNYLGIVISSSIDGLNLIEYFIQTVVGNIM